jgi:3-methylcrotonyl-CoA carboxylase beta subunit
MREVIARLVDGSEFTEYKEGYGQSIITAYARIDGWAVGIVANQRKVVKSKKGEMQFGGVIYSDSADKATRFIANCNQKNIPLVFLQDVTGFMVGSRSEHGGIIKDGAKLVNAVSNSVVPKFTIIVGNSYGAGNYAMCGKAYDPRLIVGWPSAQRGRDGRRPGQQGDAPDRSGRAERPRRRDHPREAEAELLNKIRSKYEETISPVLRGKRLVAGCGDRSAGDADVDLVGDRGGERRPGDETWEFNMGVLQSCNLVRRNRKVVPRACCQYNARINGAQYSL